MDNFLSLSRLIMTLSLSSFSLYHSTIYIPFLSLSPNLDLPISHCIIATLATSKVVASSNRQHTNTHAQTLSFLSLLPSFPPHLLFSSNNTATVAVMTSFSSHPSITNPQQTIPYILLQLHIPSIFIQTKLNFKKKN